MENDMIGVVQDPKAWDDIERDALILARHKGRNGEYVAPSRKIVTAELWARVITDDMATDRLVGTIDLIDGKPDGVSITLHED